MCILVPGSCVGHLATAARRVHRKTSRLRKQQTRGRRRGRYLLLLTLLALLSLLLNLDFVLALLLDNLALLLLDNIANLLFVLVVGLSSALLSLTLALGDESGGLLGASGLGSGGGGAGDLLSLDLVPAGLCDGGVLVLHVGGHGVPVGLL